MVVLQLSSDLLPGLTCSLPGLTCSSDWSFMVILQLSRDSLPGLTCSCDWSFNVLWLYFNFQVTHCLVLLVHVIGLVWLYFNCSSDLLPGLTCHHLVLLCVSATSLVIMLLLYW